LEYVKAVELGTVMLFVLNQIFGQEFNLDPYQKQVYLRGIFEWRISDFSKTGNQAVILASSRFPEISVLSIIDRASI